MKKTLVILSALLLAASSAGFASEGKSGGGYGGGSATPGSEFETPRGRGEEASDDDPEEKASGAWSKDKVPGKDKPSDKD